MTQRPKRIIILAATCVVGFTVLVSGYTNCLTTQDLNQRVHGTETGNPFLPSMKIVAAACQVILKAHPELNEGQCQSGVAATSFSDTLGVPANILDPFRTLIDGEQRGAITANLNALNNCLSDIGGLDPSTSAVQAAYNPTSFNPFFGVAGIIPGNLGSCPQVYSQSTFPNPTPSPAPPPGTTVVDFDNPTLPGQPSKLIGGLFEGIDFPNDQWGWNLPYNADTTNHIYMDIYLTSAGFSFSGGPQLLVSMNVFSASQGGTLTVSDDMGQTVSRYIPADMNMHLVQTGFAQPSNTITVTFTAPNTLGIDDITYMKSTTAPPISFVQGYYGTATAPSNSVSFDSNSTAGNLIVVQADSFTEFPIISVSDDQGNSYQPLPLAKSNYVQIQIWAAKSIKGGPLTVTVHYQDTGHSNYNTLSVFEYAGVDPVAPVDSSLTSTGMGMTVDTGLVTTHFPNDLVYVAVGADFGSCCGVQSGFTKRSSVSFFLIEDRPAAAIGSYGSTVLRGEATQGWVSQIVTFKPQ